MDYRPLGRTGVSVSQMCLGAMMFGAFGNPDHDESVKIIHRALDAGINFIDTADGYSAGESERIVGKALAGGRRENVVLAVKFGPPFDEDPNHRGASRRWITEGIEGSLRRLQTDWIDLYQVGVPDPNTDIDETLRDHRSAHHGAPGQLPRRRRDRPLRRRARPHRRDRPPGGHDQRRRQHVELRHAGARCGISPPVEQPPRALATSAAP